MNTPRPKVRLSRALGIPLTPKCVQYFERRPYPPGEHGRKRRKDSDYSTRLKEKQRLRAQYDISETQLRAAFDRARRTGARPARRSSRTSSRAWTPPCCAPGSPAPSTRPASSSPISTCWSTARASTAPSYRLRPGDFIQVAEKSKAKEPFLVAASGAHADAPAYLEVRLADLVARYDRTPGRDEVPVVCEEQLVVEYYSR